MIMGISHDNSHERARAEETHRRTQRNITVGTKEEDSGRMKILPDCDNAIGHGGGSVRREIVQASWSFQASFFS